MKLNSAPAEEAAGPPVRGQCLTARLGAPAEELLARVAPPRLDIDQIRERVEMTDRMAEIARLRLERLPAK